MFVIRWILGRVILLLNALLVPKVVVHRSQEQQAQVDQEAASLALYQYAACPFCVKVRRSLKRQSLHIELRDARSDPGNRTELLNQGGKQQVPCLRITESDNSVKWLYESTAIIGYLEQRFAPIA